MDNQSTTQGFGRNAFARDALHMHFIGFSWRAATLCASSELWPKPQTVKHPKKTLTKQTLHSHVLLNNRRWQWLCAMFTAMALGYASRKVPGLFPSMLGKYPGDALWATMVFFAWKFVYPLKREREIAGLALATSFLIECLKLYKADWIVSVRSTTLGHLVFGHVFSVENLLAYMVGIALGIGIAMVMRAVMGSATPSQ
jgi:Protein of unknown function (DUF2809)